VDGSTPVKLEVDSVGARQILNSSGDFGGSVVFFFLVVQLCPFSSGSVLIGADRWFRCYGRGWIDVVFAVVERRWSGGWVVRYWSATLVRWVLLLRRSAMGWGWGRPGWRPVDGLTPAKLEVDSTGARQILDSSRDFGGSMASFFVVQLCPFLVDQSWSVLIGSSVALAVGGSTSCVRWLNGSDPVVEWCGIEVLL
jgi:hypothetical protein